MQRYSPGQLGQDHLHSPQDFGHGIRAKGEGGEGEAKKERACLSHVERGKGYHPVLCQCARSGGAPLVSGLVVWFRFSLLSASLLSVLGSRFIMRANQVEPKSMNLEP